MRFIVEDRYLKNCRFSSPFGMRIHPIRLTPDGHRAIDVAMPVGTPLIAPLDGEIYLNAVNNGGSTKGYGYYVILKLINGDYVLYAHLRELSNLSKGQKFKEGDIVAYSGNTGSSTGPHVHFEYHKKNFKFRSQVKGTDTAIDPVTVYPKLKGMSGKNLGSLSFEIKIPTNSVRFKVDGKVHTIDGFMKDGYNYVKIRDVFESMGKKVTWDSKNSLVIIS